MFTESEKNCKLIQIKFGKSEQVWAFEGCGNIKLNSTREKFVEISGIL